MGGARRKPSPAKVRAQKLVEKKPWKEFHVFHEKWPHWRAEDVLYWVWFRHTRKLKDDERTTMFRQLISRLGKTCEVFALSVGQEETHLLLCQKGRNDFSKALVAAKRKAGKEIVDATGERFPPFFEESLDRIVRDEGELDEVIEKMKKIDPKGRFTFEL